jgi:tetratricopeptide (TPR) repeat protein
MHFENLASPTTLKEYSTRWFFGDGCTSADPAPDHVYLLEGDYDVTLVLAKGYDEKKRTMKVHAAADWDRQARAIDLREDYYDLVKGYDIGTMEARQAWRAMVYFDRIAKRDDVVRAGRALLSRENGLAEETVFDAVKLLAETMRVQEKDLKEARALLLSHETRMKNAEYAAALALAAGDIDMWHLKDLESAEACYRRVIFTYAEKADRMTLRKALVRMGDIYRWRHDGEKAREFLHRAGTIAVDDRSAVQRSVRAGFLARSIEEFITQGDMQFAYEFLVQWAWEFPEDQIDGYWTELRVKWLIKNKEYPGGIAEVESLLQLNPKTPYAPSLLWLAADCAEASGDKTHAVQLLERVLTDYPEAKNKDAVVKRTEGLKKGKK